MVAASQEHVYYADRQIWVTDRRILSSGEYTWYSKMRRVGLERIDYAAVLKRWMPVWFVLSTGVLVAQLLTLHTGSQLNYAPFDTLVLILDLILWGVIALAGVALVVALFLIPRFPKGVLYTIQVFNRLPGRVVFATVDKIRAERILAEIEHAISEYRIQSGLPKPGPSSSRGRLMISADTRTENRAPSVIGDLVAAGDKVLPLSEVKSARVAMALVGNFTWMLTGLSLIMILNSVAQFASQRLDGAFHTIALVTSLALAWALASLLPFGRNNRNVAHFVSLQGTFGKVIAYATVDKQEAQEVKAEIDRALQSRSHPLSTQSNVIG